MVFRIGGGVALAGLALVAACRTATEPASAAFSLRTDRDSYTALLLSGAGSTYGFRVITQFTNNSDSTIYLARCFPTTPIPIYGVELVGKPDPWGSAYNTPWGCVGHYQQLVVAPGATRIDTLHLSGPHTFDGHTGQPFGVLSGPMRLDFGVQGCRGDGFCVIPGAGESNVFSVATQP